MFIESKIWGEKMMDYDGKVAVVTGGASGIGRALCMEFARRGAVMIIADIYTEGAQIVADRIISGGGRADVKTVNVVCSDQIQELVDFAVKKYGKIDYFFNNAGINMFGDTAAMTHDDWKKIIDINLWGVINGVSAAYRRMKIQGFGHIINTASAAGIMPAPMGAAYAMTKHAIVGLSTSLRAEAQGLGIKVSVVCPGFIQTGIDRLTTFVGDNISKEIFLKMSAAIKRMSPEECARIIIKNLEKNKNIITVTNHTRKSWLIFRLSPQFTMRKYGEMAGKFRKVLFK
jgi:NAD(P)-dependent dehydrogenase (short-subunit alcohol dehydrogenase family)